METEDIIVVAAVAAIGFLLYKKLGFEQAFTPFNKETGIRAFQAAGTNTSTGIYDKSSTLIETAPSNGTITTFKFSEDDFSKLNFAQRALITLDKIIPGTKLTEAVLR